MPVWLHSGRVWRNSIFSLFPSLVDIYAELLLSLKLKLFKHRLFGFDFNFLQFPSVQFSDILRPGESDQKKLIKSKRVGVVEVVFSFLAFLCFLAERKPCLTIFSEKLKARKANKE